MNNKLLIFIVIIIFLFFNNYYSYSQFTKTVVAVTGSVINYNTKQPETVNINVFDNSGRKINSTKSNASENGYYYVTGLFPGNTYIFVIKENNFLIERLEISIPNTDKYIEISRDFLVKPNAKGTSIKFPVTPFELNKSKLRYGSSVILNDIINTVKYNPKIKFKVVAYPDKNDNLKANLELTQKRAEAIIDYFSINGVDPAYFTAIGNDKTDPNYPPPTKKESKGKRYLGSVYLVIE